MTDNNKVQPNSELKPTACVLCSMNCGLQVNVEENHIVDVSKDESNPITLGHICNKAYSIDHYVHHKQRLMEPMKRKADGSHEATDWKFALDDIGQKLSDIAKNHGGDKIALAGLGGQANHSDVLYGLSLLKSFKSPWFFSAYAQEKTQHHMIERLMLNSPPHSMMHPDPWHSDVLIIIGTNPLHSNRGYKTAENLRQFKKDGKTLYVIDPRVSETARKADTHIAHKPGSDIFLLSAMVAMVIQNNWYQKDFVEKNVVASEEFFRYFRAVDIDAMCQQAEVERSTIEAMVKDYCQAEKGSLFWDTGIEWIPHTTMVSWLSRTLVVLTDNYGRVGGNTLRPGFMADGHLLESKQPFVAPETGIVGIPALGPFEMFSPNLLVDEINAGNIKALIVSGANPLRSYADSKAMTAAFKKLDLLVVLDTSYTETAMAADYVLATPGGYEKWEWSTFGRKFPKLTVHLRSPVVQSSGDVKTEAEIFNTLLANTGGPAKAPAWFKTLAKKGWENNWISATMIVASMIAAKGNPVQAFVRWINWAYDALGDSMPAKNVASLWVTCQLVAFTRFRQFENIPTKNPFKLGKLWFRQILDNPNGTIMATLPWDWHRDTAIGFKDKKIRLAPELLMNGLQPAIEAMQSQQSDFPFILMAGERSPWTANTIQRDASWRKGRSGKCLLKVNPDTAAQLGLENDDIVELETSVGTVDIPVNLDKGMHKDCVSMPNGMGLLYPDEKGELKPYGVSANDLTDHRYRDEFTGIPYHKTVPCRLKKKAVSEAG